MDSVFIHDYFINSQFKPNPLEFSITSPYVNIIALSDNSVAPILKLTIYNFKLEWNKDQDQNIDLNVFGQQMEISSFEVDKSTNLII